MKIKEMIEEKELRSERLRSYSIGAFQILKTIEYKLEEHEFKKIKLVEITELQTKVSLSRRSATLQLSWFRRINEY